MVANDGGHIMQLVTLSPRLPIDDDQLWLTVRTPQTESLLSGRPVCWMNPAPPRDYKAALENGKLAKAILRRNKVTAVFTTGASLALSVVPPAWSRRIPCYYIESATRVDGPSLTGRILSRLPGVAVYTQHDRWASGRWRYGGSVFEGYIGSEMRTDSDEGILRKVVVSVGTQAGYGFRRLIEHVVTILPPEVETTWQTGATDVSGLGIIPITKMPAAQLFDKMAAADVVIAHAGTGSALAALQAGRLPVLAPRRPEFNEHVDSHQAEIAGMLADRHLAIVREADSITKEDLYSA